ncbi:MAG: hypothetical protein A2Y10_12445 [Planctomycetes bacterium GWF2_41_51]|nr:MAG: hypothetical protein A2Y10_12445 [Planctomycetes bacterium GWF2_41_51]HBG27231.1 hypothetical protein [Phycisphaerales bacterium]
MLFVDNLLENILHRNSYREFPAAVNSTNLKISGSFARKTAKHCGFKILGEMVSRKKVPDGTQYFGGQKGILLRKN